MVNPRHNQLQTAIQKHTILSLTCANGISIISVTAFFVSIALILNVENGTHVGICLREHSQESVNST